MVETSQKMRRIKTKKPAWLVAASAAALSSQLYAFEAEDVFALRAGPVAIRPYASVSETFNDNIRYQSEMLVPQSDFITSIAPGMRFLLGHQEVADPFAPPTTEQLNYLSVDYKFDQRLYAQHSDMDGADHSIGIRSFIKGNRISLSGSDDIAMINSVMGGGYMVTQIVNRNIYRDSYRLSYRLTERTSLYLAGTHDTTDFSKSTSFYDGTSLTGTFGGDYRATTKLYVFSEFYYSLRTLAPNSPTMVTGPDQDVYGGFMGVRGVFTRFESSVKIGYESRMFSGYSLADNSPVADASLRYRFTDRAMATLSYSLGSGVWFTSSRTSYASDSINLMVLDRLGSTGRWTLGVGGSYGRTTFDDGGGYNNREDTRYSANVRLSYLIKLWMVASADYEFENFGSSYPSWLPGLMDYQVNRISCRLSVGY